MIENITVQGFRGFNVNCQVSFCPTLTLVYGPNSFGKSSLAEAFEWLMYGRTSRSDDAPSQAEFVGSLRNCHLDSAEACYVEAVFHHGTSSSTFRAELGADSKQTLFSNGIKIDVCPLTEQTNACGRPLILQHALRSLLSCKPDERFSRFAALLGLDCLNTMNRDIVSLCVKPFAIAPTRVETFMNDILPILESAAADAKLGRSFSGILNGKGNLPDVLQRLKEEALKELPAGTEDGDILVRLQDKQTQMVAKVFDGRVVIEARNDAALTADELARHRIWDAVERLASALSNHASSAGRRADADRLGFIELGLRLLNTQPGDCPFCQQSIDASRLASITAALADSKSQVGELPALHQSSATVRDSVAAAKRLLTEYIEGSFSRCSSLLATQESDKSLLKVLSEEPKTLEAIVKARDEIARAREDTEGAFKCLKACFDSIAAEFEAAAAMADSVRALKKALEDLFKEVDSYHKRCDSHVARMASAQKAIDANSADKAGTRRIELLIQLLARWTDVTKYWRLQELSGSFPQMRKAVDQYVAQTVMSQIEKELAGGVQKWYNMIETKGDPDVHFAGFSLPTTQGGEQRGRRISVDAHSYGKPLASAVAGLSESKLNALGLSIGIASYLAAPKPVDFLIIDDPIQSWDSAHADRLTIVLRTLVEQYQKQVIVLSHDKAWIERLKEGCQTLNGKYYEITGYTKDGPFFKEIPWCPIQRRLDTIDAILKDPTADTVRLQQAEQEYRFAAAQMTSDLYFKHTKVEKSGYDLSATSIRKLLTQCGVDTRLVDALCSAFDTVDPAHHVAGVRGNAKPRESGYAPDRGRIRTYLGYLHELKGYLK